MAQVPEHIRADNSVKDVRSDGHRGHLRVQPFGNSYLFYLMEESDEIRPANIATFENGDLKVNYKLL